MKTEQQARLECLRTAMMLATAKIIKPAEIIPYAMEFHKWVDGCGGSALDIGTVDVEPLHEKFRTRR